MAKYWEKYQLSTNKSIYFQKREWSKNLILHTAWAWHDLGHVTNRFCGKVVNFALNMLLKNTVSHTGFVFSGKLSPTNSLTSCFFYTPPQTFSIWVRTHFFRLTLQEAVTFIFEDRWLKIEGLHSLSGTRKHAYHIKNEFLKVWGKLSERSPRNPCLKLRFRSKKSNARIRRKPPAKNGADNSPDLRNVKWSYNRWQFLIIIIHNTYFQRNVIWHENDHSAG